MKLDDILGISSLKDMSTEELREHLKSIRHNRTTEATLVERKEKKSTRKAAADMLSKLSPEEIEKLRSLLS